jgi:hypothetical protein
MRSAGWTIASGRQDSTEKPLIAIPQEMSRYFDDEGVLTRDLPFWWTHGIPSKIQTEFARYGLCVMLDLGADEGDGSILAGRNGQSDLCRLIEAFDRLEALGYIAEPDFAYTNSSGWSGIHERQGNDARAIFWNSQSHLDCFDNEGMLLDDLPLQWSGDPELISSELRETGLVVEVPEVPEMVFYVCPDVEDYV